ncbi:hypothetical protein RNJ44_00780 [Nakaseomyces bracarensis]|uniref:Major facilitator superfamily (MFS) profile domain-containing protein n=1 Tax=Nakaseomyces bracarensis TaxID=273131 RepID=A0ABR4NS23_9SACH
MDKHISSPFLRDIPTTAADWRYIAFERHKHEVFPIWKRAPESSDDYSGKSASGSGSAEFNDDDEDSDGGKKSGFAKYWPIVTTGAGLFSDGYINNSISTVSTCLSIIYGKEYSESRALRNISSIVFAGTVAGQLIFGYLADHFSRKSAMLLGTSMLILFTILCSGAWGKGTSGTHAGGLFTALTVYRFFLGIAIGSEYSSSSPAAAEASNLLPRGKRNRYFIWFTNSMIDFGFVAGAFVPLVLLWICGSHHLTPVWRLTIGLGAIPPCSLFILRLYYREGKKFRESRFNKNVPVWRIIKFYWFRVFIISAIWFLYDFSAYAFGTYSSIIIGMVLPKDAPLYKNFGWNVVFNLFYMPGTIVGAVVSDYLGPRLTISIGLVVQSAIGFALAGALDHLKKHIVGFVFIYGVFITLGEFSAGNNIGVIASKMNATPVRGTLYGIAAMIGKVGAFVGTYVFPSLIKNHGLSAPYYVASALCIFSAMLAFFLLPDLDQDAMKREDDKFIEYLISTGYDVSSMGMKDDSPESDVSSVSITNVDEKGFAK